MMMKMIIAIFAFFAITPPKMVMMMKMNIDVTQSIFKLGPPDFAWK